MLDCLARDGNGEPCLDIASPVDLENDLAMPGGNIFHDDLSWPWLADGYPAHTPAARYGVEIAGCTRILLAGAGTRRGGGVSGLGGQAAVDAMLALAVTSDARLPQRSPPEECMTDPLSVDRAFLGAAVRAAQQGLAEGGIPIGAALVVDGGVLATGWNKRVQLGSAIRHGETDCLENAGRLPATVYARSTMVTTLSPCDMCTGAILLYKIPRVIIGENRTFYGGEDLLRARGVEVVVLDDEECVADDDRRSSPTGRRCGTRTSACRTDLLPRPTGHSADQRLQPQAGVPRASTPSATSTIGRRHGAAGT